MNNQPPTIERDKLLNFLGRGGSWQYYWSGLMIPAIWFPVGKAPKTPDWKAVYFNVHPGKRQIFGRKRGGISNVEAINCLYAEFDGDKALIKERISKLHIQPGVMIDSGGGVHCYWLLSDPVQVTASNLDQLKGLQARWVAYVGADEGAKDLARILRLPGSINHKYNPPRPVTFIKADFTATHTLNELAALLPPVKEKPEIKHTQPPTDPSEAGENWLQKALDRATPGNRNETGFWLATQLRDAGMQKGAAKDIMRSYQGNVTDAKEPYTEHEAMATLTSAYSATPRDPAPIKNPKVKKPMEETTTQTKILEPAVLAVAKELGEPPAQLPDQPPEARKAAKQAIQEKADPWKPFTLVDAYADRPPVEYAAKGLFALPSLNIVYGPPGCLKSFLMADLLICIASGQLWLPPAPWQNKTSGIETTTCQTMWLDFDMGEDQTHDRFAALARARELSINTPVLYYSMPNPWLDASNKGSIGRLIIRAKEAGTKLIIIDNLGTISGGMEENSGAMIRVMSLLRQLAEETGAALILIHHQRKAVALRNARAGEALRGHSSIEAAIDLGLHIERDDKIVTIKSTKTRRVDVLPFSAYFTFEHKAGTKDLQTAKFFSLEVEDTSSDTAIQHEIESALTGCTMNKTELAKTVKEELTTIGINRIRNYIDKAASEGKIKTQEGKKGGLIYIL